MIAKLKGMLDSSGPDWAVVDVGGVGYKLFCSGRTLAALPAPGGRVELAVETHVREDHIHLYGFAEPGERDWFNLLCGVQGVGARVALGVLSTLRPVELLQAVAAGDKATIARAPHIGPKLAGRIASELADKVAGIALGPAAAAGDGEPVRPAALDAAAGDAVSALINLGYRQSEALVAVQRASRRLGEGADLQGLIRTGLQELAP